MDRRQFVLSTLLAAGAVAVPPGASGRDKKGLPTRLGAAAYRASRRYVSTRFGLTGQAFQAAAPLKAAEREAVYEEGGGTAATFDKGDARRCLAPDLMGLDYSEVAEERDLSPRSQTDMLVAFLDRLSIPAVDLIANDSGHTVAQLLMAQHPRRVRTVILTDCDVPHISATRRSNTASAPLSPCRCEGLSSIATWPRSNLIRPWRSSRCSNVVRRQPGWFGERPTHCSRPYGRSGSIARSPGRAVCASSTAADCSGRRSTPISSPRKRERWGRHGNRVRIA